MVFGMHAEWRLRQAALIICQELCPPGGQGAGRGAEVPLCMPQGEREHVDREGTLRFQGHCGHSSGL